MHELCRDYPAVFSRDQMSPQGRGRQGGGILAIAKTIFARRVHCESYTEKKCNVRSVSTQLKLFIR